MRRWENFAISNRNRRLSRKQYKIGEWLLDPCRLCSYYTLSDLETKGGCNGSNFSGISFKKFNDNFMSYPADRKVQRQKHNPFRGGNIVHKIKSNVQKQCLYNIAEQIVFLARLDELPLRNSVST